MKCPVCHVDFDPADLEQVFEHEHGGTPEGLGSGIKGVFVGRTFKDDESGNVEEIRLNRDDLSFDVTFRNGKKYRYLDVPVEVMETSQHALSIGAWISRTLKGEYRYYHMNGD